MCDIILSDLVPLAERGVYQGVLALTYSFACGIGPPVVSTISPRLCAHMYIFNLGRCSCRTCILEMVVLYVPLLNVNLMSHIL